MGTKTIENTYWTLQNEEGKFFSVCINPIDYNLLFKDDSDEAMHFATLEQVKNCIKMSRKALDSASFRWPAEFTMHEAITKCVPAKVESIVTITAEDPEEEDEDDVETAIDINGQKVKIPDGYEYDQCCWQDKRHVDIYLKPKSPKKLKITMNIELPKDAESSDSKTKEEKKQRIFACLEDLRNFVNRAVYDKMISNGSFDKVINSEESVDYFSREHFMNQMTQEGYPPTAFLNIDLSDDAWDRIVAKWMEILENFKIIPRQER